jgi:PAS domain S-box-containing protein
MRINNIEIKDADIFELLLDNFPDMIHSINDDGQIVYTNKTAEILLGYKRSELIGMNIRQIYADEVLEDVERGFRELKKEGDKTVESVLKAKDGTRIPVEIRSFSIYNDKGEFVRTFSILRDIRKLKELQKSLIHASRLAAIGELASGIAHDINNPLTVILLCNEMAMRILSSCSVKDPQIENCKSHLQDIHKASDAIRKLVDHLRNFARGITEKYELVDLYNPISDAIFMAKSKIMKSGATVQSKVIKGKHYAMGSPNQLEQVFVNLIGNACDAVENRPVKEIVISISSAVRDEINCWKIDVTDTGVGIPPEIQEDIFHAFFTTKPKGKGTGLGLSICRGIVRDHKGEITVQSEVGKGTTFSVYLPVAASPD